jgi:putative protease
VEIGVDCLKIEGRTKSHYYAARATQVYRQAIDDALAGRPFSPRLLVDLESLANRGYTDGFYQRHASRELQNYRRGSSENQRQIFVGEVRGQIEGSGWSMIDVKNKFAVGDELELLTPAGNHRFRASALEDLEGNPMREARGGGYQVRMPLPVSSADMGLITRFIETPGIYPNSA